MLKKITLRNFKSFRDSTFELAPLTLIVGANASGKSNFVDALRFLQGCARGLTVGEIFSGKWEGSQQIWLPIRGGEQEVFNFFEQAKNFEMEVHSNPANSGNKYNGIYQLKIGLGNEGVTILKERLAVEDEEYVIPGPIYDEEEFP